MSGITVEHAAKRSVETLVCHGVDRFEPLVAHSGRVTGRHHECEVRERLTRRGAVPVLGIVSPKLRSELSTVNTPSAADVKLVTFESVDPPSPLISMRALDSIGYAVSFGSTTSSRAFALLFYTGICHFSFIP